MLLSVRFAVMILLPPFASPKVNPFVGCMDSENVPHVIVRDVMPVLDLHTGQDVCQSIYMEVNISDMLECSISVAMGRSPALVDVNDIVCGLDVC